MTTDLGTDIKLTSDLPTVFALSSGLENLGNAIARRLSTPRGSLVYDPDYGFDLRDSANAGFNQAERASLRSQLVDEIEKDVRVLSANVELTFNLPAKTITVNISGETQEGPYDLILMVTSLTIQILKGLEVVVADQQLPIEVGPPGPPGPQGPAGPPGEGGGGGGLSGGAVTDEGRIHAVSDGNETVVFRRPWDFGLLPAGTIAGELMGVAKVASGTCTLKLYVGGTRDGLDGTLVCTVTTTSSSFAKVSGSAGFTNPTGLQWVKITLKNSSVGNDAVLAERAVDFR